MAALAAQVIGDMRPMLGGYVAVVVAGWEPAELTVSRPCSAVLGALIGGVLFAVSALLG